MSVNWKFRTKEIHKMLTVENKTQQEIANFYNTSKQLISQIIKRDLPELDKWEYGKRKQRKEDIMARTKEINLKYDRASYQGLTDLQQAFSKAFTRKKQNSKQTGWTWDVTMSDIQWNTVCPILGLELDWFAESRQENSPSFDRIDSSKGYVVGNVQIVSWRANRIKNDGTKEEHYKIYEYLTKIYNDNIVNQ
jgi:hypothetical protein